MSSSAPARIPKAERTRRQIMAAAEVRFATAGFDKTRLEDVANDIGMVGSTILYHYADKRELYRAVLANLTSDLLGAIGTAIDAPAPPRERLVELVRAAARKIASRPTIATIALREVISDGGEMLEQTDLILDRILELFEDGARAGEIRPVHAEPYLFFTSIAGAILFTVAALPTMIEEYPDAPRAEAAADRLEHDAVAMAQRLLGLSEPQPI